MQNYKTEAQTRQENAATWWNAMTREERAQAIDKTFHLGMQESRRRAERRFSRLASFERWDVVCAAPK